MEKNDNIGYHYCSLDAFMNITKNSSIYLSDIVKTIELEELLYPVESLCFAIKKHVEFAQDVSPSLNIDYITETYRSFLHSIGYSDDYIEKRVRDVNPIELILKAQEKQEKLNSGYGENGLVKTIDYIRDELIHHCKKCVNMVFICSFSKNRDLLSQWREYGDHGQGISLGLDLEKICNSSKYMFCRNIIYMTIKDFSISWFSNLLSTQNAKFLVDLSIFKNDFFAEEDEEQLIYIKSTDDSLQEDELQRNNSSFQYRKNNQDLVGYIDWKIPKEAITEVVLGPKSNISIDEMTQYLENLGYKNVSVIQSKGTYRKL